MWSADTVDSYALSSILICIFLWILKCSGFLGPPSAIRQWTLWCRGCFISKHDTLRNSHGHNQPWEAPSCPGGKTFMHYCWALQKGKTLRNFDLCISQFYLHAHYPPFKTPRHLILITVVEGWLPHRGILMVSNLWASLKIWVVGAELLLQSLLD